MVVVFALLMPGMMLGVTMLLWRMENFLLGEHEAEPYLGPVLVPDVKSSELVPPAPRQRSRASQPAGVVSAA